MSARRPCLVYAHNTGAAEVLAPIVLSLSASGVSDLDVIAHGPARGVFERSGIEHTDVSTLDAPPLDLEAAMRLVSARGCSMAILGVTNLLDRTNAHVTLACQQLDVPTVAFFDNWVNWDVFGGDPGDLRYGPDLLGVMDDCARAELVSRGFPGGRIAVVGQPHLDRCVREAKAEGEATAGASRGARNGQPTVWLVISQRVHRDRSLEQRRQGLLDVVLDGSPLHEVLTRAAQQAHALDGREVLVLLRPHPVEEKPDDEWKAGDGVTVRVDASTPIGSLLEKADTVLGLYGMPMLQAFYTGRRAISLAGIIGGENPCIDRYHYFETVDSASELIVLLSSGEGPRLGGPMTPLQYALVDRSIGRCTELVARLRTRQPQGADA